MQQLVRHSTLNCFDAAAAAAARDEFTSRRPVRPPAFDEPHTDRPSPSSSSRYVCEFHGTDTDTDIRDAPIV